MKCPNCSFENENESKFCKECGTKLETSNTNEDLMANVAVNTFMLLDKGSNIINTIFTAIIKLVFIVLLPIALIVGSIVVITNLYTQGGGSTIFEHVDKLLKDNMTIVSTLGICSLIMNAVCLWTMSIFSDGLSKRIANIENALSNSKKA